MSKKSKTTERELIAKRLETEKQIVSQFFIDNLTDEETNFLLDKWQESDPDKQNPMIFLIQ